MKKFYNERLDRRTIYTVCGHCTWLLVMALFRYFKLQDGLPDPRGMLSTSILSTAIAQANHEVQEATGSKKKNQRPYKQYSARESVRAAPLLFTSQNFPDSRFPNHSINVVATNTAEFVRKQFVHADARVCTCTCTFKR